MVAKGKNRWRKTEEASPSRRVSSDMEKASQLEASTTAYNSESNMIDPIEEHKATAQALRFRDEPLIHDHIRKQDYSIVEKYRSFWSAEDLKGMKEEMRKLVQQFGKGSLDVEEDFEAKIIERYTRKETIERKRRRKCTVSSLLSHQKSFGGEFSERWLSKVYMAESYKSQQVANLRAVSGEQQRLKAPPAHQAIVRHNNKTQGGSKHQVSDLVLESQYLSRKLLQLVDYCTNIKI
ncbi:MAG: hypothetical protein SGBAC_007112 [Bacillariaceae sp.]